MTADIAIGAPLDDDGKGAVYIYLGGSQGPVQDKVQKITASSIRTNPPLTSFGHHISKSTSQLNSYQYPGKIKRGEGKISKFYAATTYNYLYINNFDSFNFDFLIHVYILYDCQYSCEHLFKLSCHLYR